MNTKRLLKQLSTVICTVAFLFAIHALEVQAGTYLPYEDASYRLIYENAGDGLVITGFEGSASGDLLIPDEIKGYKVTKIGQNAFRDDTINTIGFTGKLIIGNNVKSIEDYAFYGNEFTGELLLPDGIESIGLYSFAHCYGFTGDLVIPSGIKNIGMLAFSHCKNIDGKLVLPNSLTHIPPGAFYNCSKLSGELILPDSIISIGQGAFDHCIGFSGELKIPNSIETIGVSAFSSCHGFQGDLVIPASVKEIGRSAFANCMGLNNHVYLTANTTTIDKTAFCLKTLPLFPENTTSKDRQIIILYAPKGSYVESYANTYDYSFAVWDGGERNPFLDVKTITWYYPYVKAAVSMGFMGGKSTDASGKIEFDPTGYMTRAEFVQMLYNKEGKPEITYSKRFTDVPENAWYANAVLWAAENNIVAGVGDGTVFDVYAHITREQMVTILQKYATNFKEYDTFNRADLTGYQDMDKISSWAKENIRWALSSGIIKGQGDYIAPRSKATRAEGATMLYNFIKAYGK